MTHLSYLDLLPEDLIGELYTHLHGESKKLIEFGELFKRVYDKMIKNITEGNIEPEKYFYVHIDEIMMHAPTVNKILYHNVESNSSDSVCILLNQSEWLYGFYKDDYTQFYDRCWNGYLFLLFKIKYLGNSIDNLVTNKEYYVMQHYSLRSEYRVLNIDYTDSWKYMWNTILTKTDRRAMMSDYLEK